MNGRILVIDKTRSPVPLPLNEATYSVDLVQDQNAGLQRLTTEAPDVIIVKETPEAESWQICQEIRRISARPLIVIDTCASVETSVKTIKAGADYFIRKPCGPLEFSARVGSLLRRCA